MRCIDLQVFHTLSAQPHIALFGTNLASPRRPVPTAIPRLLRSRMKSLLKAEPSVFESGLRRYESALPPKPGLKQLEAFMSDLREEVKTRSPQHITSAEYSKLIEWKLSRGKWRPRLQKFADAVNDEAMVALSERAFRLYSEGDARAALGALTEIKGCGPASGSLVLALVGGCFMGDEILEAVFGERVYSVKAFLGLQEGVERLGRRLGGWNAWDLERAVYAIAKLGISERKRARDRDAVEDGVPRGRESGAGGATKAVKQVGRTDGGEKDVTGLRRSKRIRKMRKE